MEPFEPAALMERLAVENRMLLALLRLGCTLQEADRILAQEDAPQTGACRQEDPVGGVRRTRRPLRS